jgi:hypothetical protein
LRVLADDLDEDVRRYARSALADDLGLPTS